MMRRFHGKKVIEDNDLLAVMGNYVLETNSNNEIVLRHYDMNGVEDKAFLIIDLFFNPSNIMKGIKVQVKKYKGNTRFLISESTRNLIEDFSKD